MFGYIRVMGCHRCSIMSWVFLLRWLHTALNVSCMWLLRFGVILSIRYALSRTQGVSITLSMSSATSGSSSFLYHVLLQFNGCSHVSDFVSGSRQFVAIHCKLIHCWVLFWAFRGVGVCIVNLVLMRVGLFVHLFPSGLVVGWIFRWVGLVCGWGTNRPCSNPASVRFYFIFILFFILLF